MLSRNGCFSMWSDQTVDNNGNLVIRILVTDGRLSWESVLEEKDMPPARRSQIWVDFLIILISALRGDVIDGFKHLVELDVQQNTLVLTVTEQIDGSNLRSLLLKRLLSESTGGQESVNKILSLSAMAMCEYRTHIQLLLASEENLKKTMTDLQRDLSEIVVNKESLQTEMLQNMCLLLNSKSSEIRSLRSTLNDKRGCTEYSNAATSAANNEPSFDVMKLSLSSSGVKENTKRRPRKVAHTSASSTMAIDVLSLLDEPVHSSKLPDQNLFPGAFNSVSTSSSNVDIISEGPGDSGQKTSGKPLLKKRKKRKLGDSSDDSEAD